jgi:DNA primase
MAGITNAVALCSASLTAEQIELLRRFEAKELILVLDGDDAGRRGVGRAAGALLAAAMPTRVMVLPQGRDPDEHVLAIGGERFKSEVAAAPALTEHLVAVALPAREQATFEQKVKAIAELRPTVAQVPEGLERTLLIGALSRGLGVAESELGKRLQGKAPAAKPPPPRAAPTGGAGQPDADRRARRLQMEELLLLAHLLHDPDLAHLPQSEELQAIEHVGLRQAAAQLMEGLRDGHAVSSGEVLAGLAPALREQLSDLLDRVKGQAPRAHREEFIQKCALHRARMERKEEDQLQEQLRALAGEIGARRRQVSPDDPTLRELIEEHVRLTELKRSLAAVHRPKRLGANAESVR